MRKILSVILTAGIIGGLACLTVAAIAAPAGSATYCFDNDNRLSDWEIRGAQADVGLKLEISTKIKESGRGSLAVVLNSAGKAETKAGTVSITADKVGLDSFAGCTMQISYYTDTPDYLDNFAVFSDGIHWTQTQGLTSTASRWITLSETIPVTMNNTHFGFTFPTFKPYNGTAVYIDNVIIFDADGNAVANLGDFQASEDKPGFFGGNRLVNILLLVLLVVLLAVIAAGIYYLFKTLSKRYK